MSGTVGLGLAYPASEGVPTCPPGQRGPHTHALQPAAWNGGLGTMWQSHGGQFHLNCFPYTLERDLNCKHMSPQSRSGSHFPPGEV